ncbi:hypothetical protein CCAX7_008220 [Capsulimonas corticalis]|uniref:Uncharacterized protein n=1 Tax=Capsulimonas corticalis TaxID=2219043 RepID=A0A402CTW7_9BACT|nr:hypothetical protein [Capsulimonas corticalis]BDI28771.1 hypothetical protein CCAX7_008220 [Capsulimonas corticalis]
MWNSPKLELHLYLKNGDTHKFVQHDPELIRQTLSQINHKVFAQPALLIHGDDVATAYPGSALNGIGVVIDPVPEELLRLDPHGLMEQISEEDYQFERRRAAPIIEGRPFVMLSEIGFSSGLKLWLKAHVSEAAMGLQERQMLHNTFAPPTVVCRRMGGGVSIWNRAQMLSYSFSPKPKTPTNAWPAERQLVVNGMYV